MSRTELSRNPRFAQLSPEVGELDEAAVRDAMAQDADETLATLIAMSHATDEALRAAVRRIVPRLVLDQARRGTPAARGVTKRRVVPIDRGDDLDLDRSLDSIVAARAEARAPHADELKAVAWARPQVALCLLVDASGSMNGARLATAATTAAACIVRARGEIGVVAFASRPTVLQALTTKPAGTALVESVLRLRGHGTTALSAALEAARRQLAKATAARRVTVLLSDCRETDDVDPAPAMRALDEVIVLAPADDSDAAAALCRSTGAAMAEIASVADVAPAITRLLGRR